MFTGKGQADGGGGALAMVFSDSLTLYQQGRTHYFRPASGSRFPRSPYSFELVLHCPKLSRVRS